jgi:hypothetical protein
LLVYYRKGVVSGNALWNVVALSANGSVAIALKGSEGARKMDHQRNLFMVYEFSPALSFSPLITHPFAFFPFLCPKLDAFSRLIGF